MQLIFFVVALTVSKLVRGVDIVDVYVHTDRVSTRVSERFLSITMDAGVMRRAWDSAQQFKPERLLNMAKALAPAIVRLGGTAEDFLYFDPMDRRNTSSVNGPTLAKFPNTTVGFNETIWDMVNDFSHKVGWDLIFGLNALLRRPDGSWDPTNAVQLMKYSISKGYHNSWELGNGTCYDCLDNNNCMSTCSCTCTSY